jgi:hypothetical protein
MKKNILILSLLIVGGLQAKGGPSRRHHQVDQYTPLMMAPSLAVVKDLVNNKQVDVNAATWQYDWGHYVTALDCFKYAYNLRHSDEDLAIINFLETKHHAKSAGDMPGWGTYSGAVRAGK